MHIGGQDSDEDRVLESPIDADFEVAEYGQQQVVTDSCHYADANGPEEKI